MNKLAGKKIAILVANGFEQIELEKPRQALEEEGAETLIVSPEPEQVLGWHHFDKGNLFKVDVNISAVKAENYDGLLLPGGVINPDQLRLVPEAIQFIKEIYQQNKPIAAICHGPWPLINAGVVRGKKVTSWPSLKIDLMNAGAHWLDESVVKDGMLVTSRKPDDIPDFNKAMILLMGS